MFRNTHQSRRHGRVCARLSTSFPTASTKPVQKRPSVRRDIGKSNRPIGDEIHCRLRSDFRLVNFSSDRDSIRQWLVRGENVGHQSGALRD